MRVAVLLSDEMRRSSGATFIADGDASAVALALGVCDTVTAIHAGEHWPSGLNEVFGFGVREVLHLAIASGACPLSALSAQLQRGSYDLVLAGTRAPSPTATGLLPYSIAASLRMPLVCNVLSAHAVPEGLRFLQQYGRSHRRSVLSGSPVLATVSVAAAEPARFAPALLRRGRVQTIKMPVTHDVRSPFACNQPPPRCLGGAADAYESASARERLARAVTPEIAERELLVDCTPDRAAAAILDALRRENLLNRTPPPRSKP